MAIFWMKMSAGFFSPPYCFLPKRYYLIIFWISLFISFLMIFLFRFHFSPLIEPIFKEAYSACSLCLRRSVTDSGYSGGSANGNLSPSPSESCFLTQPLLHNIIGFCDYRNRSKWRDGRDPFNISARLLPDGLADSLQTSTSLTKYGICVYHHFRVGLKWKWAFRSDKN